MRYGSIVKNPFGFAEQARGHPPKENQNTVLTKPNRAAKPKHSNHICARFFIHKISIEIFITNITKNTHILSK